jgi:hypothetical protein
MVVGTRSAVGIDKWYTFPLAGPIRATGRIKGTENGPLSSAPVACRCSSSHVQRVDELSAERFILRRSLWWETLWNESSMWCGYWISLKKRVEYGGIVVKVHTDNCHVCVLTSIPLPRFFRLAGILAIRLMGWVSDPVPLVSTIIHPGTSAAWFWCPTCAALKQPDPLGSGINIASLSSEPQPHPTSLASEPLPTGPVVSYCLERIVLASQVFVVPSLEEPTVEVGIWHSGL